MSDFYVSNIGKEMKVKSCFNKYIIARNVKRPTLKCSGLACSFKYLTSMSLQKVLLSTQCTLNIENWNLHTTNYKLHIAHSTLYTVHYTLHSTQCPLPRALHDPHSVASHTSSNDRWVISYYGGIFLANFSPLTGLETNIIIFGNFLAKTLLHGTRSYIAPNKAK